MLGQNFTARYLNRPSEVDLEKEIEVKLSYLEAIRRLKVEKETQLYDTDLLLMNIKDVYEVFYFLGGGVISRSTKY